MYFEQDDSLYSEDGIYFAQDGSLYSKDRPYFGQDWSNLVGRKEDCFGGKCLLA